MRKGQAALEFLTTYGWAFLTILIAIAALAYFGVLSPSKLVPERCSLPPELDCRDYALGGGNTDIGLNLSLINQNDKTILIHNVSIDFNDADVTNAPSCTPLGTYSYGSALSVREKVLFDCDATGNFGSVGAKQKLGVRIIYSELGGDFNHSIYGEVIGTIQ